MNFYIISIFPDLFEAFFQQGVIAQARKKKIFDVKFYNPRDYVSKNYKSVDDSPYGGGDGMVMAYEPLERAIEQIFSDTRKTKGDFEILHLSPKGEVLNDHRVKAMASMPKKDWILVCGRYAGLDQRFIYKYIDREISIGDYVVSGGELPAMVFLDAVLRHLPGVLGNPDSAKEDSFSHGMLEAPAFTKPERVGDMDVPSVLKSGNHRAIKEWREALAYLITKHRRPDLIKKTDLGEKEVLRAEKLWASLSEEERELLGLRK